MFVRSWYEDLWNILGFRFSEYYLGLVGLLRGIEHWFSSILLEITREDQGKMVTSDSSSDSPPLPPIPKQYGVTKPLSLSGPTDADIRRTKELEKVRLFCSLPQLRCYLVLDFLLRCIFLTPFLMRSWFNGAVFSVFGRFWPVRECRRDCQKRTCSFPPETGMPIPTSIIVLN